MFRLNRLAPAIGMLLLLVGVLPLAEPARAQERRCFAQTNQCIEGRFLQYWQQNGGLSVFGYPVGPAREERNRDTGKTYLTQWFERNRFELHPENARPYDVLLGRLGDDTLLKQGRDWRREYVRQPLDSSACEAVNTDGQDFILCPPFRDYYRAHGLEFDDRPGASPAESLALFGLPLTQAKMETNSSGDNVVTQWFERARFEYHPTKPAPYKVLLGLLGNEIRGEAGPVAPNCTTQVIPELHRHYEQAVASVRTRLGCPANVVRDVQAAEQFFERGSMLYHASTSPKVPVGQIYVVYGGVPVRYQSTTDTWAEGMPETASLTPPPGLLEPKRGFGLVWRETPGVRTGLGWATQPERAERATLQFFQNGVMVWLPGTNFVYTFVFNSDIATAVGRSR